MHKEQVRKTLAKHKETVAPIGVKESVISHLKKKIMTDRPTDQPTQKTDMTAKLLFQYELLYIVRIKQR